MERKTTKHLTDTERAARWKAFWDWALAAACRLIEAEDATEEAA